VDRGGFGSGEFGFQSALLHADSGPLCKRCVQFMGFLADDF
jgi:hypothetical protein